MKIFVTGGAGFIGANFIHYVLSLENGYELVNYDKLTYAGNLGNLESVARNPNYRFVRGDIGDTPSVLQAMRGCDAVIHFAAESHVDRSIYEPGPVVDTNVHGTFVLLKVARELRVQKFIHISTDEVYGDLAPGEIADEDFPLRPNSPYSASKAGADLLLRSFVKTYRFPAIITRSSNNYGPYQFPEKFLPLMISNALEDKPLPVYGDGQQERDWLHVTDNCRAILAVLEHGRVGETYNIGGGNVCKNLDMVRQILRILGKSESLIAYVADRPGHDRRYALDSSKIKAELGWEPQILLQNGLRKTLDWNMANTRWLADVRGGEYRSYYQKYYINRAASLEAIAATADGRK